METVEHLVHRLRGGDLKIPKNILPKIDFFLQEEEEQRQPNKLGIAAFTSRLLANERFEGVENPTFLLDLSSDVDGKKILQLFSAFTQSEGLGATIVVAMKASNVPRDPLATLRRNTKPYVNAFKPYVRAALLHLHERLHHLAFITFFVSKVSPSSTPTQKIFIDKGVTPALLGAKEDIRRSGPSFTKKIPSGKRSVSRDYGRHRL